MIRGRLGSRFFESTRGRIVLALRIEGKTVNELAEGLELTDNAVRAHLITLERDGIVRPAGTVRGFRKPHIIYELTEDARHIFPNSYDSLFNRLLEALKLRLSAEALMNILTEIGRKIGAAHAGPGDAGRAKKVQDAITALKELGGAAVAVETNGKVVIKSNGCPFADAVSEHPEVCKVAEALVQEIVGESVAEICERKPFPKCRFEISGID